MSLKVKPPTQIEVSWGKKEKRSRKRKERGEAGTGTETETNLLVLDLAGLNPCLDLVSIPLKFLDLLLQISLKLLLLIGIIRVVNLK